ncbi:MAG: NADH-quinone oxidoreductase subunit I [Bdellovibrionales bacterium]|nr:NADH-quinone oxidoreductase subunit I [Bdellovibrionales bacterium]
MAIKIAPRPNLKFWDYLYLPAIMRGLLITFKHIFRRKVTLQFPEQRWIFPFRYRGYPELITAENGIEKCVACKLCEVVCPPDAITIKIGEYANVNVRERVPAEFEIDMGRCIVCGMCEEACPVDAIRMSNTHVMSSGSRDSIKFKKTLLLEDYSQMETMRL